MTQIRASYIPLPSAIKKRRDRDAKKSKRIVGNGDPADQ
jgi:hypothetical protein